MGCLIVATASEFAGDAKVDEDDDDDDGDDGDCSRDQ
jgi:hypothetical protein